MILSALIFISMAHAETGSVAINAMQSARYEDEKARQQLEHAINKLPGFNRGSKNCKYNPECSSIITDWVKENSSGLISPAQKCEKENLKRKPPKYGIISRYQKNYPRFGKIGAACSLGNELDDKLYASKYYYSLLRLEEAQFSAVNQVAAIDSLFTSSPLSGIECDKIGISEELSVHCQKIKDGCNNIKQDDFNKLAAETAEAEKILKDAEEKLADEQTKSAVASRNVARIGSQGGLDQLKEAEEKIKSYQQIISITKKNYPWLGGDVYKKERGNYLFKDSSPEQTASNIKRALRAQLEETRKVLVEQKIPSITEATVCITNKDVSCNLNRVRKTVRDTPELAFTEDQASPEQDFFKVHQCISNSEKKTEENIQLARDIGLTAASIALIPFSGGTSLGAAGVTAGRVAIGARSFGTASNLARVATFGVDGFWTFDSGRRAFEACSGKRSDIELAQNDKDAQLCPGYSNKFNQSVRSFDSCLTESLLAATQLGALKSAGTQVRAGISTSDEILEATARLSTQQRGEQLTNILENLKKDVDEYNEFIVKAEDRGFSAAVKEKYPRLNKKEIDELESEYLKLRLAKDKRANEIMERELTDLKKSKTIKTKEIECKKINAIASFNKKGIPTPPFSKGKCQIVKFEKNENRRICTCGEGPGSIGSFMFDCPKSSAEFKSYTEFRDVLSIPPASQLFSCSRVNIPKGATCFAGAAGPLFKGFGGGFQYYCPKSKYEETIKEVDQLPELSTDDWRLETNTQNFTSARWSPFTRYPSLQKPIDLIRDCINKICDITDIKKIRADYEKSVQDLIIKSSPTEVSRIKKEQELFEKYSSYAKELIEERASRQERIVLQSLRKARTKEIPSVVYKDPMEKELSIRGVKTKVRYTLAQRERAIKAGRIFENVPISKLPRDPGKNYYTYVLLDDGTLVYGKVTDRVEYGAKHFQLANGRKVKAAGELSIEEFEGQIDINFNLMSGTFSRDLLGMPGYSEARVRSILSDTFTAEGAGYVNSVPNGTSILDIQNPSPSDMKQYCDLDLFDMIAVCQ